MAFRPACWVLTSTVLLLGMRAGADGPLAASIAVRARALQPGEPLRIEVTSGEPLTRLRASFLGEAVFMVRVADAPDGAQRWSGWAMIGLDQGPGMAVVEVDGETAGGRRLVGTHALTIEHREFPEERLSVAPKFVEPPPEVQQRLSRERSKLAEIYRSRRDVPPTSSPFVRPVPGEPTSAFGTRRMFNGKARDPHPGIDLRAGSGTEVVSAGPGRVLLSQDLYYSGNTVIVDHGGGLFTIYAHLSELGVEEGREVGAGQPIGRSGATGRVTGPHLHWGAKIGPRPFDPQALLAPVLFGGRPDQQGMRTDTVVPSPARP